MPPMRQSLEDASGVATATRLTRTSRQQENRDVLILVELVYQALSLADRGLAGQNEVPNALVVQDNFEDI